ncbi:MAG: AAA family ATPase [Clostridiales bacterium]|nr:AAA family ATPase [Clostridiales bacterium]
MFSKMINDYDYLVSSSDDIALLIRETMESRFVELDELSTQLKSLPFYNFGKKSRIKKEIRDKKIYLSGVIDKYIEDYRLFLNNGIDELMMKLAPIEEKIKSAKAIISKDNKSIETLSGMVDIYSKCIMLLSNEPYPDFDVLLSDEEKQIVGEELSDYKRLRNVYYKSNNEITALEQTRNNLLIEIEEFKKHVPDEKDIHIINETIELISSFDALNVYKIWEKRLRTLYKQYEQPYSAKANYRHKLYLKLLFCEKYYGSSNNSTYYINIDEAQDLAPVEYQLLQRVLGSKTVFNLYGDVNQAVYEYKGISDWEEIRYVTGGNVYFLNENYRNTLQITEYCNEVFDANVTAIGLMGDEVTRIDLEDALREIERIHKKNPEYRIAIIYRRGLDGLQEVIKRAKMECVFNEVESSSISVITVEEAKGLEFEAVLVVDNYMTENEMYISYTRALENLIITTLAGSEFANSAPTARFFR